MAIFGAVPCSGNHERGGGAQKTAGAVTVATSRRSGCPWSRGALPARRRTRAMGPPRFRSTRRPPSRASTPRQDFFRQVGGGREQSLFGCVCNFPRGRGTAARRAGQQQNGIARVPDGPVARDARSGLQASNTVFPRGCTRWRREHQAPREPWHGGCGTAVPQARGRVPGKARTAARADGTVTAAHRAPGERRSHALRRMTRRRFGFEGPGRRQEKTRCRDRPGKRRKPHMDPLRCAPTLPRGRCRPLAARSEGDYTDRDAGCHPPAEGGCRRVSRARGGRPAGGPVVGVELPAGTTTTPKPWRSPRTCPRPIETGRSASRKAPSDRRPEIPACAGTGRPGPPARAARAC